MFSGNEQINTVTLLNAAADGHRAPTGHELTHVTETRGGFQAPLKLMQLLNLHKVVSRSSFLFFFHYN